MFEDNQGTILLVWNPKLHSRAKHINIKYHYIHEAVENKNIQIQNSCTEDIIVDLLTKNLLRPQFEKFQLKLDATKLT